jgi:hypothetical protein
MKFFEGNSVAVVAWLTQRHFPVSGISLSMEGTVDLRYYTHVLAEQMERVFPLAAQPAPTQTIFYGPYWYAQQFAYKIENLLNPTQLPFGGNERVDRWLDGFDPKLLCLQRHFLRVFDAILLHYGWQDETARRDCQQYAENPQHMKTFAQVDERGQIAVSPIDGGLLRDLKQAASKLFIGVWRHAQSTYAPKHMKFILDGNLNAEARAIAVLFAHPDWTVSRIAKTAGTSRTHLSRCPTFMAARRMIKAQGIQGLPGGMIYTDEDTGQAHLEAYDRDAMGPADEEELDE